LLAQSQTDVIKKANAGGVVPENNIMPKHAMSLTQSETN